MKKILNLVTILLFLNLNAQEMNENIIITDNISVHQKYTNKPNEIKWELFVKNKKQNKTIKIDQLYLYPPPHMQSEVLLLRPNVINGFIENNFLYLFIYRAYNLHLIKYDIKDNTTKTDLITVAKFVANSIGTFGNYHIDIQKYRINNELYFYLNHKRQVIGGSERIFKYDVILNKAFNLKFSEDIVIITDENETFKTLDLDTNKEKIIKELKRALLLNRNIEKNDTIKYLGYVDDFTANYTYRNDKVRDLGITFFYYIKNKSIKIATYDHYDYEWNLGTYKEEEIKYKITKID